MPNNEKLPNNKKEVHNPTWCMVHEDGVLISNIEFSHWIYTGGIYFEGTEGQCTAEIANLGLDTTQWDLQNPEGV